MNDAKSYKNLARFMNKYIQLHRNIETLENMLKKARNSGNLKMFNNTFENISNGINNRFYRAYMPPNKQPKWTEVANLLRKYPIAIMHAQARKDNLLRYLPNPMETRDVPKERKSRFVNRSNRMFDPSMKYTQRSLKERMIDKKYQMTENNRIIKELLLRRSKL